MHFLVLIVGGVATVVMLIISMRLNYLFGVSLGQSPEKAQVFGWVSVVADSWKATGPIFIYALARSNRWLTAAAATAVWVACFLYAVTSALGIAAQDRTTLTGGRETQRAQYEEAQRDLVQEQDNRAKLAPHRSLGEINASTAALLAMPIVIGERVRGTVGSISLQCTKPDAHTTQVCAKVSLLRKELAIANEASRLDRRIAELKKKIEQARERGGTLSTDPQAELLSWLTMGWLAPKDVGFGLVLLLGFVIELVSAFGPVVLSAYSDATRKERQPSAVVVAAERDMSRLVVADRDLSRLVAPVIEYMADRMVPGPSAAAMEVDKIFEDYKEWSRRAGWAALSEAEFVNEFDLNRREQQLEDKIVKFGTRYYGLRLVARSIATSSA